VLEAGVVVTPEPWALMPGVGAPRHSNQIVITQEGQEVLSTIDPGAIRIKREPRTTGR
jgi:Xaa-Pro aminopeptidase